MISFHSQDDFKNRLSLVVSLWSCFLLRTAAQSTDAGEIATDAATDVTNTVLDNSPDAVSDLWDQASNDTAAYLNAHQWVISILMIAFGILYLFFGWKLYKIIIWINGFIFGFALFQIITLEIIKSTTEMAKNPDDWNTAQWIGFGVGIAGGIIGGALALCLKVVGVALLGAIFGWIVGYNIDLIIQKLYYDSQPKGPQQEEYPDWASWIVYIGVAVIFGLLTACFQKPLVITFTAGIGSFFTLAAIGALTDTWPSSFSSGTPDWEDMSVWGWIGGMIVLWLVGIAVQCKIYGNVEHNDSHEQVPQKASV